MTGLPLILTSKFIINDIFGPSLGDSTVAIAAAFPALLSTGNLVGRLLWGTLSDRIGCASSLVHKWEQYKRVPSNFLLICWMDALGAQIKIKTRQDRSIM